MSAENIQKVFDKDKAWDTQANCLDVYPEVFFPEGDASEIREGSLEAKRVCIQCIAKLACYEYARRNNINDGVWGGLNELQRRAIRKSKMRMTEDRLVMLIRRS